MGTLYIVSTPIGNLADVSHRAIDVLRTVQRILAEDTRRTAILLRRYEIATPLVSAHTFNEEARAGRVLEWLAAGESIALVSDAGTPLLSDPGARIVRHVLDAGHEVVPIPGASAILAALVASGLPPEPFTFYGFAPKSGRQRGDWLARVVATPHTVVLFEAPGRLRRLLTDLIERGGGERPAAVARELTKMHEQFVRGTLAEAAAYYEGGTIRGEIVVVLGPPVVAKSSVATADKASAAALAADLIAEGSRPSAAARELAQLLGISRNEAYEIVLAVTAGEGEIH